MLISIPQLLFDLGKNLIKRKQAFGVRARNNGNAPPYLIAHCRRVDPRLIYCKLGSHKGLSCPREPLTKGVPALVENQPNHPPVGCR